MLHYRFKGSSAGQSPKTFYSMGNKVKVVFHSDGSVTKRGFEISVRLQDDACKQTSIQTPVRLGGRVVQAARLRLYCYSAVIQVQGRILKGAKFCECFFLGFHVPVPSIRWNLGRPWACQTQISNPGTHAKARPVNLTLFTSLLCLQHHCGCFRCT